MATKVTPEMIEQINELYLELGVKAQVARKLGISPSTVSKYIIADYVPKNERNLSTYDGDINLPIDLFMEAYGKMGYLCELSQAELMDLKKLHKELTI